MLKPFVVALSCRPFLTSNFLVTSNSFFSRDKAAGELMQLAPRGAAMRTARFEQGTLSHRNAA
jgi:hypothetical protein